jgi:hypothetical protein
MAMSKGSSENPGGVIRELRQQALADGGGAEREEGVVQDAGSFVALGRRAHLRLLHSFRRLRTRGHRVGRSSVARRACVAVGDRGYDYDKHRALSRARSHVRRRARRGADAAVRACR